MWTGVDHAEGTAEPGEGEGPRRRCFVTGREAPRRWLVRFVVGPEARVVPDVTAVVPGRGLWLSPRRDVVNTACAKGLFAKGFRAKVAVEGDLADEVERLLARRCLAFLGFARRAGEAVAGFERVDRLLATGKRAVLLAASDGASTGRERLRRRAPDLPMVTFFTGAELGGPWGRERVVYMALKRSRLAARFLVEAARLAGFRWARPEREPEARRNVV
ncbi:MAG: RNA-binding protein [Alphaproteobacteria bacterium]